MSGISNTVGGATGMIGAVPQMRIPGQVGECRCGYLIMRRRDTYGVQAGVWLPWVHMADDAQHCPRSGYAAPKPEITILDVRFSKCRHCGYNVYAQEGARWTHVRDENPRVPPTDHPAEVEPRKADRTMDMRAQYEAMARQAAEGLARLEAVPDLAAMEAGTVLLFRVHFDSSNRTYTYVSIVVDTVYGRRWYTSGVNMSRHTDASLAEFLATHDVREISRVTAWEILSGDVEDIEGTEVLDDTDDMY